MLKKVLLEYFQGRDTSEHNPAKQQRRIIIHDLVIGVAAAAAITFLFLRFHLFHRFQALTQWDAGFFMMLPWLMVLVWYIYRRICCYEKALKSLDKLARYDYLTDVYNRSEIYHHLERIFTKGKRYDRPLSVILLDIDDFKIINDQFGHQAGDEVLKSIATILQDSIRDADSVGRIGGEEFLVVMDETCLENAIIAAERLCRTIEKQPLKFFNREIAVTASFGVAGIDNATDSIQDMIRHADMVLYEAKRRGKNCVRVYNEQKINHIA